MQRACPSCGSCEPRGTVVELGQTICSECATVSHDLQFLHDPDDTIGTLYSLGRSKRNQITDSAQLGPVGSFWSNDPEQKRQLYDAPRKAEVDAHTQGTLKVLGHPTVFDQVDFLFQRARDKSRKQSQDSPCIDQDGEVSFTSFSSHIPTSLVPRRVQWGNDALCLAAACCYAVLRRQGVRIDLDKVSAAAQLPFLKVRRAFKQLHLLVKEAVQNIKLAHPDVYLPRIVAFFQFHLEHKKLTALDTTVAKFLQPFQKASHRTASGSRPDSAERIIDDGPLAAVEATALDLCAFWWPNRSSPPSIPAQLAAFASVVLAMEAHLKSVAPVVEIFRCTHAAIAFDPTLRESPDTGSAVISNDAVMSKNAVVYYKELCAALKQQAAKMPWLSDAAPISKGRGVKQQSRGRASDRLGVIVHALDILEVWCGTVRQKGADVQPESSNTDQSWLHPHGPALTSSTATRCGSGNADLDEHDVAQREIDEDEFDCFVSTSSSETATADLDFLGGDSDEEEYWPQIQRRLVAAGVVCQGDDDDVEMSAAHVIDTLTDDQVDRFLFDDQEMASLFRTDPEERATYERAKLAAGEWPVEFDHDRDAQIAALARSVERQSSPVRKTKVERRESTPSQVTTTDSTRKSKRMKSPPVSVDDDVQRKRRSKPDSRSKTSARASTARKIALQAQQEESDWSE